MRAALLLVAFLTGFWTPAFAMEPPGTAHKATPDELSKLIDGKTVLVSIFDLGPPVVAQLVWDWKNKTIGGRALVDGKKAVPVKTVISIEGEKACSTGSDGKKTCFVPYIDGNSFYEVREDGQVHAVSYIFTRRAP